jgi:hypothetical protein
MFRTSMMVAVVFLALVGAVSLGHLALNLLPAHLG